MPVTRSGNRAAEAISAMGRDEVLVASSTFASKESPSSVKIFFLRSMISGTASITTSTPAMAACISVVPDRRAFAAASSSAVTLPRATPLARFAAIFDKPLSMPAWLMSKSRVVIPAMARTWATP